MKPAPSDLRIRRKKGLPPLKYGALILAGGRSERMKRPKLLLPWKDTTIVGHLIRIYGTLRIAQLTVVHYAGDSALKAELDRLAISENQRVSNPESTPEMFSSIVAGIRWTGWQADLTHLVIVLGDQPQIARSTVARLLDFSRKHPEHICQPTALGRRGHPVILPRGLAETVAGGSYRHLKEALGECADRVKLLPVDDTSVTTDIDTPAEYSAAREQC